VDSGETTGRPLLKRVYEIRNSAPDNVHPVCTKIDPMTLPTDVAESKILEIEKNANISIKRSADCMLKVSVLACFSHKLSGFCFSQGQKVAKYSLIPR
jgi:hypothetical protein